MRDDMLLKRPLESHFKRENSRISRTSGRKRTLRSEKRRIRDEERTGPNEFNILNQVQRVQIAKTKLDTVKPRCSATA